MKIRYVFVANAIVALVFAVGLLLAPKTLLDLFGLNVSGGVANGAKLNLLAQLLGAALVVPGLFSWFAKDMTEVNARRSVVITQFVFSAVGFGVSFFVGMLPKVMATAGWSIVALFLLFALAYAYFLFMKQSEI